MPEDVFDVLNIMKSGKWDIEKLITHEFPSVFVLQSLPKNIETPRPGGVSPNRGVSMRSYVLSIYGLANALCKHSI